MRKFKNGDRIVRIRQPYDWVPIGHSCTVFRNKHYITTNGNGGDIYEKDWQLERRHIHHDLIIAWAKGAKIQILLSSGSWTDDTKPTWVLGRKYRIKPAPQTDAELISDLQDRIDELERINGEARKG